MFNLSVSNTNKNFPRYIHPPNVNLFLDTQSIVLMFTHPSHVNPLIRKTPHNSTQTSYQSPQLKSRTISKVTCRSVLLARSTTFSKISRIARKLYRSMRRKPYRNRFPETHLRWCTHATCSISHQEMWVEVS